MFSHAKRTFGSEVAAIRNYALGDGVSLGVLDSVLPEHIGNSKPSIEVIGIM